jgi:hypothetical protein
VSDGTTHTRFSSSTDEPEEPLRSLPSRDGSAPNLLVWLGPVLRPFLKCWPLLLVGMFAGVGYAAYEQSKLPVTFSAEALVAPNRTVIQVQFVPEIKTVADAGGSIAGALTAERRQALVDLVRSNSIEDKVIAELRGKIREENLQRGGLVQHISGAVRPRSEILSIAATEATQNDAIQIVNAWARHYVELVNRVYSESSSDDALTALRDRARDQLNSAQTALNTSMASSELESVDSRIRDKQNLLTALQGWSPSSDAPATGAITTGSAALGQALAAGANTTDTRLTNDYRLTERRRLDDLAQTLRRIEATRQNVRALLGQAQATGGSPSDTAALAILKTQLVAISGGLPSQIQLQLPTAVSTGSTSELESLANNLEQVRAAAAREFDIQRVAYEQKTNEQMTALEEELRNLRAQRELADAERKRLTAQRGLSLETYTALAKKVEERSIAANTSGRQVELASEATYATQNPRQSSASLASAGAAGLLVAAAIVLILWYGVGALRELVAGDRSRPLRTKPVQE